MTDGNTPWSGTIGTDSQLNHTTHLSGSTTEKNASTNWPTYMPWYDTTLNKWYRNVGSSSVPVVEEIGSSGAIGDICYELSVTPGDYTSPASATATSSTIFSDDFSTYHGNQSAADAVWITNNTANRVDVTNDYLKAAFVQNATSSYICYRDLGLLPDAGSYKIRFTIKATGGTTADWYVGICSTTTDNTVAQDGIIINTRYAGNWYGYGDDGGTLDAFNGTSSAEGFTDNVVYYFEIERTGATACTIKRYTDSTYTSVAKTVTPTLAGTVTSLRYFKFFNRKTAGGETANVQIDNVTFGYNASNIYDASLSSFWQSALETDPAIYGDFTSARNYVAFALALHTSTTTVTQIQLSISTDTTFSNEVVRTINASDFTNDTRRYILININRTAARYVQIKGVGTGVLAVTEFSARYGITGDTLFYSHFHNALNKTSVVATAVDSN